MRKLIDANVILRYLLGDHPQMSEEARRIIEDGAFTLPEIIAEVVYVLKGVYKIERDTIGRTLIEFLDEVTVENQEAVCEALSLFSETSLDFVDCILIARHRVLGDEIASFDKKLNKML
ncbi:PIN domain-containing protein [Blautia marasmi]|uniref:PIN domain-containing protein n=1 Tax=Blautia marasmi TaxID=1917868 RepID=UPI000CF25A00|nr:PIN domain-containing protein [Blautia marasmi]